MFSFLLKLWVVNLSLDAPPLMKFRSVNKSLIETKQIELMAKIQLQQQQHLRNKSTILDLYNLPTSTTHSSSNRMFEAEED